MNRFKIMAVKEMHCSQPKKTHF